MGTKSTGDQPTEEQGMGLEGAQATESVKPVDKVRELAGKAKEAVATRVAELKAEEENRFTGMQEHLAELEAQGREFYSLMEDLGEAQTEINLIPQDSMSEELQSYEADLSYQIEQLELKVKQNYAERKVTKEDPFFRKMFEAQEVKRLEKEEADLRAVTEKEIAEVTDAFTEVALSFASVGQEWLTRLGATRELNARSAAESSKCASAERAFNSELSKSSKRPPRS